MAAWKLSAAIYTPRYGNYRHWALCVQNGIESIIFEVIGGHGSFKRNVLNADPERSARFYESVDLGTINDIDFEGFKQAIANTQVDNETVEWDCQDYVLEILDKLEEECIVDGDDKDYRKKKRELKRKRGSM